MTTLTSLLFGSSAAGRDRLDHVFGPEGLDVHQLRVSGLAVDPPSVSGALLDLLDQPLSTLAANGWNTMTEVRRARRRTLESPGSREVVALGEHTITSTQEPTVEASLAGTSVTVLHLVVEVEIRVTALRLVVERGHVIDMTPGQARARATVSAEGAVLVDREFQPVELTPSRDGTGAAGHDPSAVSANEVLPAGQ
jgi:hypothetical protein